jgi:F0F1-type ATP synthase membrane subunit c/vacuolar-type H+-ATPase subunit K
MSAKPPATWPQKFQAINKIGLMMVASVFIYAFVVFWFDKGYGVYKAPHINIGILSTVKYILLALSASHYFLIRYFHKFSLRKANYLPSGAIIIFALCEAVSLYGLILFFLSGNAMNFYIFMVISLLYFYLFYPKYADWERLWQQ